MKITIITVLACVSLSHNATISTRSGDYSSFSYDVADPITGDYKTHIESRIDGFVRGQYTIMEPDGSKRVVDYTADDNGFKAHVKLEFDARRPGVQI